MINFIRNLFKPKVIVELAHPLAKLPFYADAFAAGADLIAAERIAISPGEKVLVKTGIKMKLPRGKYLKIESRSGLSVKFSLETGAGVIDENYRKEIGVVLHNFGSSPYIIEVGERVAQGVLQNYYQARFVQGRVEDTGRGAFASTGRF